MAAADAHDRSPAEAPAVPARTSAGAVATAAPRLPRGRHRLSREEVVRSQRERILAGMAGAMTEHGYVGTSVTEILRRAGVSRQTFYEQFESKDECFAATFEWAVSVVMDRMASAAQDASDAPWDPDAALDRTLAAYLGALASAPEVARVLLIETYAAGPTALARRVEMQGRFGEVVAAVLGARTDADRFACEVLVGGISTLVTARLAAGDTDGLLALQEPLAAMGRRVAATFGDA